ncbi:glycosyl transferase family 2 [Caldovatus sediminis]|uniref:Glycosyl transferase family 2 n=1 Tax=Caldovatus sediminis TaxID=2041189 RepID=A0A8J3ECV5_9PROT|nr:glycosyltransferase [Caldovatus sediminis]GGG25267.1 glycosyl transferase family 2 [Caldovatus sediminis]
MSLAVALAAALAWAVLILGRGGFWRCDVDDRDAGALPEPACWPAVAVVVPARDEAATVGATVAGLLAQDYPGPLRVVLVDDRSRDGTAEAARDAAGGDPRLEVIRGGARPAGWTGKLWALRQGLGHLADSPCDYLLFTDADIRHAPDSLRRLVARAEATGAVLVSLMARLRCESLAERALIPAFVFFFQMLYPFRWANAPRARTAAAAGGCVLLRRAAFARAGGLEPIRGAIIDDCALARRMKAQGPIWLGLTDRVVSLRGYRGLDGIRRMVARTAYAQLGYSPLALAGMLLALALVFLAPPALALAGAGAARALGAAAWFAMAGAFVPMLRRCGLSPAWGLALPGIAAAYMLFTLDSAWQEARGRGGMWKGEPGPRADPSQAGDG